MVQRSGAVSTSVNSALFVLRTDRLGIGNTPTHRPHQRATLTTSSENSPNTSSLCIAMWRNTLKALHLLFPKSGEFILKMS